LLEKQSDLGKQTQIFIEAPYRNNQLIAAFIENCKPTTQLCIAANLTLPSEWIRTRTISEWRLKPPPDLNRQPAVFIMYA
jgi:16S rRNA (cytidine1402-2'-O)-methyltransferase